jgi:hypothetical protein
MFEVTIPNPGAPGLRLPPGRDFIRHFTPQRHKYVQKTQKKSRFPLTNRLFPATKD